MNQGEIEFKAAEKGAAHIIRQDAVAVLQHTRSSTTILFGRFMLEEPKPAEPLPPKAKVKGV